MRTLAIDIGNSTLFCGVFAGSRLVRRFRVPISVAATAAGFRSHVARRVKKPVDRAVVCSVVPALTATVARGIKREFGVAPARLEAGAAHGLGISYRNPGAFGVDRLACAIGARARFPGRNVIVVDCGTATTLTALDRDGTIPGGAILPGIGLWPAMLHRRTAQLPQVPVGRPRKILGRSTTEALQSGIFHGHTGAIRELVGAIRTQAFGKSPAVVIGTGGFAPLFAREKLFTVLLPDLILTGLSVFSAGIPKT